MARPRTALLLLPCAVVASAKTLLKVGDGQCNGGVGGIGDHYCLIGGTCNNGSQPVLPPTQAGTGCPGHKEYLLCLEDTSINEATCRAACNADNSCVGFLVTEHAARSRGRCELHTKKVEYAAAALECYIYSSSGNNFTLIGRGACRTRALTVGGPQNGTHYGYMQVYWVDDLPACHQACQSSTQPCVGVEYHRTAVDTGKFKCEVHFEELSASEMSIFECYAQPTCKLSHTCARGVHKTDAINLACAPAGEGGLATCSDSLCCQTTADVSAAGVRRPAAALGLVAAALLAA